MKNNKKLIAIFALIVLALITVGVAAADQHHARVPLVPVGGSGVTGFVQLEQLPLGGTNIQVNARGLQPGGDYVSLYYDNNTCTLPGDTLGAYTANASGVGKTNGKVDDDLDEIGSVSVRTAGTLTLLACANVHP